MLSSRNDALIVSKFGHSFDAKAQQMTGPRFDAANISGSLERSHERLRRDQIDVLLLHLNDLPIEEAKPASDTLEYLRSRDHVASYGWSTDYWDSLAAVSDREGFTTVQ